MNFKKTTFNRLKKRGLMNKVWETGIVDKYEVIKIIFSKAI